MPGTQPATYEQQTVRDIAHVTLGGEQVRIRLSNAHGSKPLTLGPVHLARRDHDDSIVAGTDLAVTFSGRDTAFIPVGASVWSDPVILRVPADSDVAVSVYLPEPVLFDTIHGEAHQTNYLSTSGNHVADVSWPGATRMTRWPFLSGLAVPATPRAHVIVALGDSITDGSGSTADANRRWPNVLAARLRDRQYSVCNAGIGGNRLLHDSVGTNALARFDRDVLSEPGITDVIVLEGINDIGMPGHGLPPEQAVSAEDLCGALQQLATRAHDRGLRIFCGTVLPCQGSGYYTEANETRRQALNQWIRTCRVFDGVIDFDTAVRDPQRPTWLLPAFDCGDHLHPGDAGYEAMGNCVDLSYFR